MLEFNIKNQTISRVDRFNPATDSVDYLTAKFNFLTDDWDGKMKKALFRSGTVSYEAAINASGVCTVPFEVLVAPDNKFSALAGGCIKIYISVVGTSGTVTMPTKECRVEIGASGLTETLNGAEPTPDIYQQFVDTIKADNDATVEEIKADNDETAAEIATNNANTKAEIEALTERAETAQQSAEQSAASMKNDYANALKGTASGEVVKVDDVSPVEHTASVRASGKNLIDVTKIEVQNSDNIYISAVGEGYVEITTAGGYVSNGHRQTYIKLKNLCPQMKANRTYVLSAETTSTLKMAHLRDVDYFIYFGTPVFITEEMLESYLAFYGLDTRNDTTGGVCKISNIQFEEGETATEYTPYIDPSTVTLTRCGKNLLNSNVVPKATQKGLTAEYEGEGVFHIYGTYDASNTDAALGLCYLNIPCIADEDYTISAVLLSGTLEKHFYAYFGVNENKNGRTNWNCARFETNTPVGSTVYATAKPNKVNENIKYISAFWFYMPADTKAYSIDCRVKVQLEKGLQYTDWVAYNGATYIPNANGICDVVSLSPTMTLFTDTKGVTVECEYNRDINAVIADIYNKLNG